MVNKIFLTTLLFVGLALSGCTASFWSIGEEKGYCEEHGCNYSDAGVCGNAFELYKNKNKVRKLAYQGIDCECEKGFYNVK